MYLHACTRKSLPLHGASTTKHSPSTAFDLLFGRVECVQVSRVTRVTQLTLQLYSILSYLQLSRCEAVVIT